MKASSHRIAAVALLLAGLTALLSTFGCDHPFFWSQFRRQKETVWLMKRWAIGLETFRAANGHLPPLRSLQVPGTSSSTSRFSFSNDVPFLSQVDAWPITPSQRLALLRPYLCPTYMRDAEPADDAWGHPILVAITPDRDSYTLLSRGSDGLPDSDYSIRSYDTAAHTRDIVYSGSPNLAGFVRYPAGVAR